MIVMFTLYEVLHTSTRISNKPNNYNFSSYITWSTIEIEA